MNNRFFQKYFLPFIAWLFIGLANLFTQANLEAEIGKIIKFDTDISYDLTPGFIIGIIDADTSYVVTFGNKVNQRSVKLDEDDVFELSNNTKLFTTALIYILVNEKYLSFDDKVNSFFPVDYQNPRLGKLSIRDLLVQNTSFPKRPNNFGDKETDVQNPYSNYSKNDLLKFYKNFVPLKSKQFQHSHINYALLELVIEKVVNKDFEAVLNDKIFSVLNLKKTFIDLKERKNDVIEQGVDMSINKVDPWTFSSFAASEGIKSDIEDLLKFMNCFLNRSGTELDPICKAMLEEKIPSFNEDLFYSSGWFSFNANRKTRVFASNGRTNGHSSFLAMVPENKTAVIVLSNSGYGTKDLGMLILRMINNNWKRRPQ